MRMRRSAVTALAAGLVLTATAAPPATAATPRTSLTAIWNDVMCVACHEPLSVAQSPQAYAERDFIRQLIARGLTKPQIEQQLVAQYGPAVLGKPPARGFDLTVYLLPAAILVVGIATLAVLLPRWRRGGRASVAPQAAATPPTDADATRLEQDLARFEG